MLNSNLLKVSAFFTLLLLSMQSVMAQVGTLEVGSPAVVAGSYAYASLPAGGWGLPANGLCGNLAYVEDSLGLTLACSPIVSDVSGKIAVIDRGTCSFVQKALNAQDAGAIGVVFVNNANPVPGAMADNGLGYLVNIPVVLLSQPDGKLLEEQLLLGESVKVCMSMPNVDVKFTVDMREQTVGIGGVNLVYVAEGASTTVAPMNDNGDGTYTATASVVATSDLIYLFANGDLANLESVPEDCGVPDATGLIVRYANVGTTGGDAGKICFGKCTLCSSTVTFVVDMNLETVSPDGIHIAGSFQGWNPAATAMTDAGNGLWTYTTSLPVGDSVQYKFINGNAWGSDETQISEECGFGGLGSYNRFLVVPNTDSTQLAGVCFNSCSACPSFACNPNAIICDGFDNYATGGLNVQSTNWDTWDGTGGDGIVSQEQASTGSNSLKIDFAYTPTQDVILLLGDSTSGHYALNWKMYIPTGKKAYYNLQHTLAPAHIWAVDIQFADLSAGTGEAITAGTTWGTFTFPYDTWFDVVQDIDIDNNIMWVSINGGAPIIWNFNKASDGGGLATTNGTLGGVDFYPIDAAYKWYVDEVQFIKLAPGVQSDFCLNATSINSVLGGAVGTPVSSTLYDNTGANAAGDPATGWECFGEPTGAGTAPSIERTVWFKFTGDGQKYFMESNPCDATNYITDGDAQFALYEGATCGALTAVSCNEDGPNAVTGDYKAALEVQTEVGKTYWLMVDGFNFNNGQQQSEGQFCLQATRRPAATHSVTFQVDVANIVVDPAGMKIAGEFNGWTDAAMTNAGNGIWTFTTALSQGDTIEYKFKNGPNGWESITGACTLGGFGNRFVIIGATDKVLPVVCFNTCTACVSGTEDLAFARSISVAPNPTSGIATLHFDLTEAVDLNISVTNSLGQKLLSTTESRVQAGSKTLDLSAFGTGIYFVQVTDGTHRATQRLVVQH